MKDKLKQFVGAKRGVSPVIGVVLMVAVVVILAAVIGAFVLGLGGDQQATPQASFSLNDGTVVYEGGDQIDPANIDVLDTDGNSIKTGTLSNPLTAGTAISNAAPAGTVRVVYTGDGGSTTIWQGESGGPPAGGP